jgi:hypothetical protein
MKENPVGRPSANISRHVECGRSIPSTRPTRTKICEFRTLSKLIKFAGKIRNRRRVGQSLRFRCGGICVAETKSLTEAAIVHGSSSGGNAAVEAKNQRLFCSRLTDVHLMTIPKMMNSAAAPHLSILFGIRGYRRAASSACASSAHAISEAIRQIRSGRGDIVVTGGSDVGLTCGSLHSWRDIHAMSPDACRPFSIDRQGTIVGEGAPTLVLEAEEHAIARGATIDAIVAGPDRHRTPLINTDRQLQRDKGYQCRSFRCLPKRGYSCADQRAWHTVLNDRSEAEALRKTSGEHLTYNRVIATKSAHGHTVGAAAAMEFVLGIAAIKAGVAPPILGYLRADPHCDLPLVLMRNRSRPHSGLHVLRIRRLELRLRRADIELTQLDRREMRKVANSATADDGYSIRFEVLSFRSQHRQPTRGGDIFLKFIVVTSYGCGMDIHK